MQIMNNTWLEASGEPALTHPIDTDMVSKANSHDNAVRRSNRRYECHSQYGQYLLFHGCKVTAFIVFAIADLWRKIIRCGKWTYDFFDLSWLCTTLAY